MFNLVIFKKWFLLLNYVFDICFECLNIYFNLFFFNYFDKNVIDLSFFFFKKYYVFLYWFYNKMFKELKELFI